MSALPGRDHLLVAGGQIDPPREMQRLSRLEGPHVNPGRVRDRKVTGLPGQALVSGPEATPLPARPPGRDASYRDYEEQEEVEQVAPGHRSAPLVSDRIRPIHRRSMGPHSPTLSY